MVLARGIAQSSGEPVQDLAKIGVSLSVGSAFLTYSRFNEQDSDLLGVHVLAEAGYQPAEMATFFETLAAQDRQKRIEFSSSHPNPENRREYVLEEIKHIPVRQYRVDTDDFAAMKQRLKQL